MEEGKGERYLASGRQYGNALLGVRHQEEEEEEAVKKLLTHPLTQLQIISGSSSHRSTSYKAASVLAN